MLFNTVTTAPGLLYADSLPETDSITGKVLAAVAGVKHLQVETVSPAQNLTDLGFDSLDTVNLLFVLEEEFKISIPDDDVGRIRTVGDIIAGIRQLTSTGASEG
jgi:acyl carrier protein